MRISRVYDPDGDLKTVNPTPMGIVLRPALRGGVSRSGEALRPRSFNLHGLSTPWFTRSPIDTLAIYCCTSRFAKFGFATIEFAIIEEYDAEKNSFSVFQIGA